MEESMVLNKGDEVSLLYKFNRFVANDLLPSKSTVGAKQDGSKDAPALPRNNAQYFQAHEVTVHLSIECTSKLREGDASPAHTRTWSAVLPVDDEGFVKPLKNIHLTHGIQHQLALPTQTPLQLAHRQEDLHVTLHCTFLSLCLRCVRY